MDDLWYRALVDVEHNAARFEAGTLVHQENPAVAAQPDNFELVRIAADGLIVPSPDREPTYLSLPRPAVKMSDGSTRYIDAPLAPVASSVTADATGPGPRPMTTLAEVEETASRLRAEGRPHGERSIAEELGVSRDAVRYARGKDRKR